MYNYRHRGRGVSVRIICVMKIVISVGHDHLVEFPSLFKMPFIIFRAFQKEFRERV